VKSWTVALAFIHFAQIILVQNADAKIIFLVHRIADFISSFALCHWSLLLCYITLGHLLSSVASPISSNISH